MKKANSIGPILRTVVVCFLFFTFISTSFNLTSNGKVFIALFTIKKLKGPTHSDAGCPMEEVGKEVENRGKDKGNHNALVLWSPQNFVVTLLLDTGTVRTLRSGPSHGDSSRVPLYLCNR